MDSFIDLKKYHMALQTSNPIMANGKVTKVVGLVTEAQGPASRVGTICEIFPKGDMANKVKAEVLG
ncbi:MAG: EscN/YscN/HrcN family type III secretion system ATPase, partial [Deltaproteobacteria bacterium]|nr:EscN/YscN/HrcN family type III secretion system ATPase [Deltaproteobacteria bacterium]